MLINTKKYKILKDVTVQKLLNYGFKFKYPDEFIYRICCYKHNDKEELIYLDFTIIADVNKNEINNPVLIINCKNKNGNFYAPFYNDIYTLENNDVLYIINAKLEKELNKLIKSKIIVKLHRKHKKQIIVTRNIKE